MTQSLGSAHATPCDADKPDHLSFELLDSRQIQRVLQNPAYAPVNLRRTEDDAIGCPELVTESFHRLDIAFLPLEAPVREIVDCEVQNLDFCAFFFGTLQSILDGHSRCAGGAQATAQADNPYLKGLPGRIDLLSVKH